ncbi:MAG: hypothetical protein HYY04_06365 [Chloroflexi bacterium]|nr:hypothetical protein [Chloroflexota bacterium]
MGIDGGIERIAPTVSTFRGEGFTRRLAQGADAVSGVAAHEAMNVGTLTRQAERNGYVVVSADIQVQFALNPETGHLEVVGGRSRVSYQREPEHDIHSAADIDRFPHRRRDRVDQPGAEESAESEPREIARARQVLRRLESVIQGELQAARTELAAASGRAAAERTRARIEALERKQAEIEAARQALEIQEMQAQLARLLDRAQRASSDLALGLAANARGAGGPAGGNARSSPAGRTGVFVPAMTTAGLLVNARG